MRTLVKAPPFRDTAESNEIGSAFRTTQWTRLLGPIIDGDGRPEADEALNELCSIYSPPLRAYVRRWPRPQRGTGYYSVQDAEDIVQDFIFQLIKRKAFKRPRKQEGRFRTWLVVCLRRFLINRYKSETTVRRGGGVPPVPLPEPTEPGEPLDPKTVDSEFTKAWAWTVVETAIAQVRAVYAKRGYAARFDSIKGCLPGGPAMLPTHELANNLGVSVGALQKSIHDLRKKVREEIQRQVARTVETEDELNDEVQYLLSALGK